MHAALEGLIVGKTFDVIVTSNNAGWPLLTQACKDHIIKLVKEGAGLVMIQRGKLPEEFGDAFPLKHHWYDSASGSWTPLKSKSTVLDGLPFAAMPYMGWQCGTRANRPDKAGLPSGPNEEALIKSGRELTMAVGQWGKGRLAQLVINGPLLPNSATIRGRELREPPPHNYWEYQMALLGRFLYWAARMESPVTLKRVECSPKLIRVALTSKVRGPAKAVFTLRDRFGAVRHQEEVPVTLMATTNYVKLEPPAEAVAGSWIVDFALSNDKGTLAWGGGVLEKEGAQVKAVTLDKKVYRPEEQPQVSVAVAPAPAEGSRVRIELWDGSGRVTARQIVPAVAATQVSLPLTRHIGPVIEARAWLLNAEGHLLDQGIAVARVRLDPEIQRAKFQLMFWGGTNATMPSYLIREWLKRYQSLGVTADLLGAGPLEHSQRELDYLNMPFISGSVGMAASGVVKKDMEAKADAHTFTSPKTRAALKAACAKRAQDLADQNRLMNTMGDENRVNTKDGDYTRAGLTELRTWLRTTQYKSLAELNAEWKTNFAAWDAVMPMVEAEIKEHGKKTGSYAAWADQQQFNKWAYGQLAAAAMEGFLSVDPKLRCGPSGTQEGTVYDGRDWWLLARQYTALAGYSGSQYNQHYSYNHDLLRYPWTGYGKPNPILRTGTWRHLGNINSGLACFHWATHIDPDMTVPECGRDLRAIWLEMAVGVGQLMLEANPATPQVYVLQSSQSIHGEYIIGRAAIGNAARGAVEPILEDIGAEYRHISYEQLAKGELDKTTARVLLLPHTVALSKEECEGVRRWVRAGGTVVADLGAGTMTQHGRLLDRGQLDDVFGIDRAGAGVKQGKWTVKGEGVGFPCTWVETGLRGAAKSAWTASDGQATAPVFFQNTFGRGRAIYCAFDVFGATVSARTGSGKPEGYAKFEPLQKALVAAFEAAGFKAPVAAVFAEGKATRVPFLRLFNKTTGVNRYVLATRDQGIALTGISDVAARLVFDRPAHIYDVLAGAELGFGDRLDLSLGDNTVRLLALLPYRVTGVNVTGLDAAKPGRDAALKMLIESAGEPGLHVYRVEVVDPTGAFRRTYSDNIVAQGGRATFTLPFALNDAPGEWTVHIRDVATGASARKVIRLEAE